MPIFAFLLEWEGMANGIELSTWLINAFNGEWLRTAKPHPKEFDLVAEKEKRGVGVAA